VRRLRIASVLAIFAFVATQVGAGSAVPPTELFFSEYIEGSSNNKALEIFNGTGSAVDLAANSYNVQMYFNGSTTAGLTINLVGTAATGDVHVLAQSSASPVILAQADQTNGAGWFNGDDAVVLRKGATVIDAIGQVGVDPGTEWGTGLTSTMDNTLRRKATITGGDPDETNAFDPAVEWDGFATDAFDGLGAHTIADGDAAPFVSSTTPANGATEVAPNSNVTVTFSEPVDVAGSWFSIACASSGAHTATASGGPTSFTLDPDADFAGSESCTVTVLAAQITDQDSDDPPDTMASDASFAFTTVLGVTPIHDIQGAAHRSPLAGATVKTQGIVTALRLSSGAGFYLQDASPDADDATSEGIFVFTGGAPTVAVGDAVQVVGTATEFRPGGSGGLTNLTTTELTSPVISTLSTGNAVPTPTVVGNGGRVPPSQVIDDDATGDVETSGSFDESADGIDFWESLEGMLLQLNDAVAVGPTSGFGETPVVGDDGGNASVDTARGGVVISATDFNPERILLDDTLVPTPVVNVGDGFSTPVLGVLDYSFGNFKLNVTTALSRVDGGLTREATTPPHKKLVTVATYNVENLDPGDGSAFAQHAAFIVNHLRSPDVIAIEEIQDNDGPTNSSVTSATTTWDMLVAAIQAAGGPAYQYRQIDPVDDQDGGEPGGNIRVGFLFRSDGHVEFIDRPGGTSTSSTAAVSHPAGPRLTFSPGRIDPGNGAWTASRKPVAGEFKMRGEKVIVIANHFNSKGGDQPLFGRFQPPQRPSEVQRHAQAAVVNAFVDSILAGNPNANVIVLGDINDFEFSETVSILEGGVLSSLMNTLPQNERYSYVFEGNSQVLDQILVSHNVARFQIGYDVVHVNSEFADQASDHEPQVARIDFKQKAG
jgi:predicted extracellular nuclease